MITLNCILIEDDLVHRKSLEKMIEQIENLNLIESYHNYSEWQLHPPHVDPELLFFDIQVPGESGISAAKSYQGKGRIVYTTSLFQHAHEAFEVDAVDYLVKPFTLQRLKQAVEKVINLRQQEERVNKKRFFGINQEDIEFIESNRDYLSIHACNRRKEIRLTLKEALALLDKNTFARAHKSFVVNTKKISVVSNRSCIVAGNEIPLGKTGKKDIIQRLNVLDR